jgi:hypothetical protein
MGRKHQFSEEILAVLRKRRGLRIRAGTGRHRFIGIWAVVVNDRVFVRSWSVKPDGWYRTFQKEPRGTLQNRRSQNRSRGYPNKKQGSSGCD